MQVIPAGNTSSRFPHILNCGYEKPKQCRDDGDHDEQFDQGKANPLSVPLHDSPRMKNAAIALPSIPGIAEGSYIPFRQFPGSIG